MEERSKKRKLADICLQKTSDEYTVGWICAICTEYIAAQVALDEEHEKPDYLAPGDQNDYAFGRIGKHNVAITVLPEYGIESAALVARDMLRSFANIKVGLMVGIGGGAPSERHDIRLGDIVVGIPREGHSGVLQYDFGKMVQGQPFQPTRQLNQSPRILRAAVNGLHSQYRRKGHGQLREIIDDILERNSALQDFGRPDLSSDRLYRSEIVHPGGDISIPDCSASCGDDPSKLIVRSRRIVDEGSPVVHYGLIASANMLMKDAMLRDKLALEKNVLCFEMEAAGLMNHFPCLVVRGISDYSDSHKNKQWQGYAAIAAAAYAKDLLHRITPDSISVLQGVTREEKIQVLHNNDKKKQKLLESLQFDQHNDRHDNIKAAHAETCKWLEKSVEYLDWLNPDKIDHHHGFLWIKGKPGAGKSTIMKFALASTREIMRDRILLSFFFNARGGDLEKSTLGMYRSLLLQLLQQRPVLQDTLELDNFTEDDRKRHWYIEPLKSLFHQAIENLQTSKVICFVDALDECDEDQVRDMISFFEYMGDLAASKGTSFLVCFSSRHYPYISIQNGLNLVLENQEEHAQDIIKYVRSELEIGQSDMAIGIRADLPKRASGVFLWVILVVLILNKEYDKGQTYNLQARYQEIPEGLHELFKNILTQNSGKIPMETIRCLQWLLFAKKALQPKELYFAVISDITPMRAPTEIPEHDIKRFVLNSSMGLAEITVSGLLKTVKTVQFIHESVKDFLLKDGLRKILPDLGDNNIHGQSHEQLKHCCFGYISGYISMGNNTHYHSFTESLRMKEITALESRKYPLLRYAIYNLLYHANEAQKYGISQAGFLKEFETDIWKIIKSLFYDRQRHLGPRLLYKLAEENMNHLIGCHPSKITFSEVADEGLGIPLFAALAYGGNTATIEFLKAQAESTLAFHDLYEEYYRWGSDRNRFPPMLTFTGCSQDSNRSAFDLIRRADTSHKFTRTRNILSFFFHSDERDNILKVALLLNIRRPYPHLNWADHDSQAPFLYLYNKGNQAVFSLLINKFVSDANETGRFSHALLQSAVEKRHGKFIESLLQEGVKIDAENDQGQTALGCAVSNGDKDIVQLLIKAGANINVRDRHGITPLMRAARQGHVDMAIQLLEKGSDVKARDNDGRTPLIWAASRGHTAVVYHLLENGSDVEAANKDGLTPLLCAVVDGNEDVAIQLLERGSNIEAPDKEGHTPLIWAVYRGQTDMVRLLLEKGARVTKKKAFRDGSMVLDIAQMRGNTEIIELLSRNDGN